jgi:hypothetical protein
MGGIILNCLHGMRKVWFSILNYEAHLSKQCVNHDDLVAGIVKRLSDADDPDDIILDICQETGLSWSEAEGLVNHIQEKDDLQITEKQMPLLIGVAFFVFAAGLILTGYGLYAIATTLTANTGDLGPPDITSYILPVIEKGVDPASALKPAIFPYFNLILGFMLSPFSALLFGVAMIFGSLFGMRDAWSNLLNR